MSATLKEKSAGCKRGIMFLVFLLLVSTTTIPQITVQAAPSSKPYIAYRTSPFDQPSAVNHGGMNDYWSRDNHRSVVHQWDDKGKEGSDATAAVCPLQFSLGLSKRPHSGTGPAFAIRHPPVLYPVYPGHRTGGRLQVVYVTQYEHLDLLSPTIMETPGRTVKEALLQASDFPLLLESSSFHTAPILHDVNGDGIVDAVLVDYDGAILTLGLVSHPERYMTHAQVPRIYVRKEWVTGRIEEIVPPTATIVETTNTSTSSSANIPKDPYHSYFEYFYSSSSGSDGVDGAALLRGITANRIDQDAKDAELLEQRRNRRVSQQQQQPAQAWTPSEPILENALADGENHNYNPRDQEGVELNEGESEMRILHRRLQEVVIENENPQQIITDQDPLINPIAEDNLRKESKNYEDEAKGNAGPDAKPGNHETMRDNEANSASKESMEILIHDKAIEKEAEENKAKAGNGDKEEHSSMHGDELSVNGTGDGLSNAKISQEIESEKKLLYADAEEKVQKEGDEKSEGKDTVTSLVDKPRNIGDASEKHGEDAIEIDAASPNDKADFDQRGSEGETYDDAFIARDDEGRVGGAIDVADPDGENNGHANPSADDVYMDDPNYGRRYDDYYGYDASHHDYYDTKHYIRIPPHVLADPVLVEIPKAYTQTREVEDILLIPVSYYFDEDAYEGLFSHKRFADQDPGDDNEVRRGLYVANAIMAYVLGDTARWSGQAHLDLSTDFSAPENATLVAALPVVADTTRMGAFALGSPAVADLDGDGSVEVIIGTSMGMVYALDARQLLKRESWPVQMPRPVESRILVEDVVGNTNLEVFVADIGGNVACFSSQAERIWHRNIVESLQILATSLEASSPLTLGDIDGDGVLDVVLAVRLQGRGFVVAFNAATGEDLTNFPIELEKIGSEDKDIDLHEKLPQPLLVNLHADQSYVVDYIRRNGAKWTAPKRREGKVRNGGNASGLHVVQPFGKNVYVIEAGSGCTQAVDVGSNVVTMVQADDVHGTGKMDLVIATEDGKIVTFESQSPWHPLNTWNRGELRGRENAHAHGYSASQGIYVHDESRQFNNILGVYVPVTFEIFDNRPNIKNEPEKRKYMVEIRDGTSSKRVLWRQDYTETGIYTERVYIRYGPGYYSLSVILHTSHGLVYEDNFRVSYNINFLDGFSLLLWLPLLLATSAIFVCGSRRGSWDDEDSDDIRASDHLGILGKALPT